ncbi:antibiotic biosynthesis monooxygenase [Pseudoroseomonas wenyumeiae]|uniref:Antibiotic biosynthesis monooxygenase n=1 Tax=Teichococcus wenyumeiae TaxID=2478470 RepID=A0A3A9JP34_9PROT|nr:putative quinol monooxygenase [Pseudoroseomonas wenyumeiae]RKK05584.1 antibiotic biosynthesis monooxygenase [Pseudoroseomonas wenyumeiae]RMI19970.1 antibiotic biosynthesis monooxygenase [Pseudoroseomonas wenyumeiae]
MSVVYEIRFTVRPEALGRFTTLLNGVLDAMRAEAGFRNAVLHRDPQDPCRFMLYETWADHQEVVEVEIHRPYRAEWHAALPEILAAPREVSVWQPLRADGLGAQPALSRS